MPYLGRAGAVLVLVYAGAVEKLPGAGAGAGGEISGNGTMAGQAARQLSSAPTAKVAQG